ncbi:MAG TPA: HDOD domain-containing protein [Opitutus sp.]|nr:HDOD domain-containing protein [Opitutus sp.]
MANILLVDPNEIARNAMKGILERGNHRFAARATVAEAWEFLRRNVSVDLVFLDLKLAGEGGLALVERLRGDALLKLMPAVIYTATANREAVHRATELKAQNFLVKPYRDDQILAEVAKALADPWRNRHFEEEKSFCAMMGYKPDQLRALLDELRAALESAPAALLEMARTKQAEPATARLAKFAADAETAGAWGVVEVVNGLSGRVESGDWVALVDDAAALDFAARMIFARLNPEVVPEDFISPEERDKAAEAAARALWFKAPEENRCPVVEWPKLAAQLDALSGCPVIDTVAAVFQMAATGHRSSLDPLMDLAERDPGLSAHLLVAANQIRRADDALDAEPIENVRLCVSFLGEIKLAAIAAGLVKAEERRMEVPPCSWTKFWMFQVGVAWMARYTCRYLEFHSLESRAFAAGLLHDIGKLLLLRLYPVGFQAVLDHAFRTRMPLTLAEQKFLGCTTREMAAHFADHHGLLPSYAAVMRWVDAPSQAGDDAVLVASVSLARELCRQNHVGWGGEISPNEARPIADTPAWQILGQRIFPSFNLAKFEAEAHAECRELKWNLHGGIKLVDDEDE